MQIGQTYKIKFPISLLDEKLLVKEYKARLLQETKHFYTFEYNNDKGYIRKETIAKSDYGCNPNLIMEA